MEKINPPSQIEALAQSVKALGLHHDFAVRVLAVLTEQDKLLYAIREDLKMLRATSASADRLSREALLKLSDLNKIVNSSK